MSNPDAPKGATGPTGTRAAIGNSATSREHPPHVTENDKGAAVQQQNTQAPNEVPVRPANAGGTDKIPAEETMRPIQPTSMYEGRPAEHKDIHVDGTDPNTE